MNISEIQSWTKCEAMALHSKRPPAGRYPASAYVGTLAHHFLVFGSGAKFEASDFRQVIAWDSLTRDVHDAELQGRTIAEAGRRKLAEYNWTVTESEASVAGESHRGRIDLIVWSLNHQKSALLDLKTGVGVGAAWLQVGGYLELYPELVDYGAILHVPRVRVERVPSAWLELRHASGLIDAWRAWTDRVDDIARVRVHPSRSPGDHCGSRCSLTECPVRVERRKS